MRSSLSASQNQHILKNKEKKDSTKEKKSKEKNTLVPRLEDINSAMLFFKNIFPSAPIKEIAEKLVEDATDEENPKPPLVASPKQFKAMLGYRLKDWERSKPTEPAKFEPKNPVRTEVLPDWFETSYKASETAENESVEDKKKRIEAKLRYFRGEKTLEESKQEVADLLRLIDERITKNRRYSAT